jgi:hypothetical protein
LTIVTPSPKLGHSVPIHVLFSLAKFGLEKYDFSTWPKFARFRIFFLFFFRLPDFYDKFRYVAKNIQGSFFLFFSYFHILSVAKSG